MSSGNALRVLGLAGATAAVAFFLHRQHPLMVTTIIRAVGILLVLPLVLWVNRLKTHLVLAAAGTCFGFAVLFVTSWMRSTGGIGDFDSLFYGIVFIGSIIVLVARIVSEREKRKRGALGL